ncbi:MAG: hypothetical protein KAR21_16365 [Spirochaetales bacterium]|nr:hypothetical protein [Spirochaetales bacterium]
MDEQNRITKINPLLGWLLKGDSSVVYQTHRDLLGSDDRLLNRLRKDIAENGWGRKFLDKRNKKNGMWGNGIYSPKWISTTYTILDLKNLGIHPETTEFVESGKILIHELWGIPQNKKKRFLDLCICGMLLNLCCYAGINTQKIYEIINFIMEKQFPDGGWNCRWEIDKDHSSLHTTINILEGLQEYLDNNYSYKRKEILSSIKKAHEFILIHKLFKSDHTDKIIDKKMIMLSHPVRWRYDILRCMDYFSAAGQKYDNRMKEALAIILKKKMKNNHWPVQQKHSGIVHFTMEETGKESRWNTLRSLRVLKKYRKDEYLQLIG